MENHLNANNVVSHFEKLSQRARNGSFLFFAFAQKRANAG